jgi:hypothetical protein
MTPLDPATQSAIQAAVQGADFMAGKDAKWWFAFVLIIGALAGLIVLRWLLASHQRYITTMESQLTEQRAQNAALNKELLSYITTDHIKSIEALNRMSDAMERLTGVIEGMEKRNGS